MSKLKHSIPSHSLKTIYDSLILSHISYGITLWGSNNNRIYKLQKKAVRIIYKSKYNAHTSPPCGRRFFLLAAPAVSSALHEADAAQPRERRHGACTHNRHGCSSRAAGMGGGE